MRIIVALTLILTTHAAIWGLEADWNRDKSVDFKDFLVLSESLSRRRLVSDLEVAAARSQINQFFVEFEAAGNVAVVDERQLRELMKEGFDDNKEYVILAVAVDELAGAMEIENIRDGVVCFDGPLASGVSVRVSNCKRLQVVNLTVKANVEFSPIQSGSLKNSYGDEFGAVNVVDCDEVSFVNLTTTNERRYQHPWGIDLKPGTSDDVKNTLHAQASCALNIARSTNVTLTKPRVTSYGKSTVCVYGNSTATLTDATIKGAYFGLNIGASDVTVRGASTITSELKVMNAAGKLVPVPGGDSHAAVNLNSSYKIKTNGQEASRNSKVVLDDVTIDMTANGRPVVSGNSNNPKFVSSITLRNPTLYFQGPLQYGRYGLVGYSSRWHSIDLKLEGGRVGIDYSRKPWRTARIGSPQARLQNFVTTTATRPTAAPGLSNIGLGRFVHYQNNVDKNGQTIDRGEDRYIAVPRISNPKVDADRDGRVDIPPVPPSEHLTPVGNLVSDGLDVSTLSRDGKLVPNFDPNDPADPLLQR